MLYAHKPLFTAGSFICLLIWRGQNSGPYMHTIHFGWSFGTMLAPLLAAPFLSTSNIASSTVVIHFVARTNNTIKYKSDTSIGIYYLAIGSIYVLAGLMLLYFGYHIALVEKKQYNVELKSDKTSKSHKNIMHGKMSKNAIGLMLSLVCTI